eukprot:GDKJ01027437.1.p1 GENE.GDKJ01027437.1~~GDKJ01027437.1.p1  ORF type:complete len:283 (-),score=97.95 GDKJ01027437.1:707-1555(-)
MVDHAEYMGNLRFFGRKMLRGTSKLFQTSLNRFGNYSFFQSGRFAAFVMKTPSMGDSISEGSLQAWVKNVGDYVHADEILCKIETDKIVVDVHAQVAGKIISHAVETNATVFVKGDLCTIDTDAPPPEGGAAPAPKETPAPPTPTPTPTPASASSSHKRVPMIKFPLRGEAAKTVAAAECTKKCPAAAPKAVAPTPAAPAAPTVKSGSGRFGPDRVEVYSSWNDLPSKLRSLPLSEAEIEAINMGGVFSDDWATQLVRQAPKPKPAPKAAGAAGAEKKKGGK